MRNSKLSRSLNSFSIGEWKLCHDFIDSPFHNKNQRVKQLFEFLSQKKEKLGNGTLEKESCFASIYPEEAFQEQKLFNIASLLFRKVQEFQAQLIYRDRSGEQQIHLMTHQAGQQLWEEMEKSQRKLEKGNWPSSLPFADDFYAYQSGMMQIQRDLETQRHSNESFFSTIHHLDRFFLASRLKLACEHLNRSQVVVSEEDPFWNMEALVPQDLKEDDADPGAAALTLYLKIFRMFSHPGDGDRYRHCVEMLKQSPYLLAADRRDGTAYCINYCIREINAGTLSFQKELFQLYHWAIEEQVLLEEGVLGEWHFKNIVRTAIRQGALTWAERFVNENVPFLKEEVRENAYSFNQASIFFEQKAYSEARKLLLRVRFTDLFYSLDSKVLLSKIYYEVEEDEPLRSMVKSLQIFLRRKSSLSPAQKTLYVNFAKALQALSDLRDSSFHATAKRVEEKDAKLKQLLVDSQKMTQYAWVMEKALDLRG